MSRVGGFDYKWDTVTSTVAVSYACDVEMTCLQSGVCGRCHVYSVGISIPSHMYTPII